jgi:hypothetical protein
MSLGDLSSIGRSVLRSSLLPPAITREWLKTTSLTSDSRLVVGMPWEIFHMEVPISLDSNKTRVVDVYSKNGGLGGYSSWLFLSPDHGIGFTILVASPEAGGDGLVALSLLSELTIATWIPAAEAAAREAATANIAGTYIATNGLNSSISLEVVPEYKGLRVAELTYNGTNVFELLEQDGASLQYMNLRDDEQLAFRAIFQTLQLPPSSSRKPALIRECNAAWGAVDGIKYGGYGLDEFIFHVDGAGKATAVDAPALRTTFLRRDTAA